MSEITRETLHAYLDEALGEADAAKVEQALRESEPLRKMLAQAMQERDRGEHSLGAVWRRARLTCPDREKLGGFLLDVLEDDEAAYIRFHLDVAGCPYCLANLADLKEQKAAPEAKDRRRRIFQAGKDLLPPTQ
jgi:hypothetical protein